MLIPTYRRSHLDTLEDEAVHILRELAAERERLCLLFSGGKDSIVLLRLAEKAFRPARFPFPLLHVDTGHNFPETIAYRDRTVAALGERLIVAHVQDSIDKGRAVEETGPRASRNRLQTTTLLDAIEEHQLDAAIGGARRDEEKARAKERIFSHRDEFGQWDPKQQRPELWSLYNGRVRRGEHLRVFPLSNWTELDVWQYIAHEDIPLPSIYFAHDREVFERDGMLYAPPPRNHIRPLDICSTWRIVIAAFGVPCHSVTYLATGSSSEAMWPSRIAAPTSRPPSILCRLRELTGVAASPPQ